eukprot:4452583-Amphidinium_carterae.1
MNAGWYTPFVGCYLDESSDYYQFVDLGSYTTVYNVTTGKEHSCVLFDYVCEAVKCWGGNSHGQLGYGDVLNRGDTASSMGDMLPQVSLGASWSCSPKTIYIVAGDYHTCAMNEWGRIKCWGDNSYGQLGYGDNTARGKSFDMGDYLPEVDLGIGLGRRAVAIAAGGNVTCAVLRDGELLCWGENSYGQLGQGDTTNRGDAENQMGECFPSVDLAEVRAVAVATSGSHTCAILNDGTLRCFGRNDYGQLGQGHTIYWGDDAGATSDPDSVTDCPPSAPNGDCHSALDNVKCLGVYITLSATLPRLCRSRSQLLTGQVKGKPSVEATNRSA